MLWSKQQLRMAAGKAKCCLVCRGVGMNRALSDVVEITSESMPLEQIAVIPEVMCHLLLTHQDCRELLDFGKVPALHNCFLHYEGEIRQ